MIKIAFENGLFIVELPFQDRDFLSLCWFTREYITLHYITLHSIGSYTALHASHQVRALRA